MGKGQPTSITISPKFYLTLLGTFAQHITGMWQIRFFLASRQFDRVMI